MALSRNLDESNLDQGINNILAVDDNAEESITVTAADVLKKLEEVCTLCKV